MNKPPQTNLAIMQTDGFKIARMRENKQNETSYNRWLKSLENQLEQEQKLRDKRRAAFMKTLPPTKSKARSKMTRRARSNSMSPYKSRSTTRAKTRSKPYSV